MGSAGTLKRSPPAAQLPSAPAKEQCLTLQPTIHPIDFADSDGSVASLATWFIPAISFPPPQQLDNVGGATGPEAVAAVLREYECRPDAGSVAQLAREVARSDDNDLEDCGVMYLVDLGLVQQLKMSWDARSAHHHHHPACHTPTPCGPFTQQLLEVDWVPFGSRSIVSNGFYVFSARPAPPPRPPAGRCGEVWYADKLIRLGAACRVYARTSRSSRGPTAALSAF